MYNLKKFCILFTIIYGVNLITGIPVFDISNQSFTKVIPLDSADDSTIDGEESNSTSNGTHKDLYVIKAVVYEIGILTEVSDDDNSTDDENFSHERVDLTFFDAHNNGSYLDLGDIPLPVQTNVSGQVLTGIAPIHIGAIQDANDILSTLPLTGTIVNITHSDTSFINLSHRPVDTENGTIIDPEDLAKLPGINDDDKPILIDNTNTDVENSELTKKLKANSANSIK